MSLSAGVRFGSIEILAPIGAGGMGEVYRARDTRLKREIAVKVLPAAAASDSDRVARFQREAELLATLNHPNVAAIYGVEEAAGRQALLLELVEGPTLADRLEQGPIPVADTIAIARQIADALDAAHERGIIHRDLKPANIKVRDDGTVKVLDFGLARALDVAPAGGAVADLLTVTDPRITHRGVILGTAAYMSPEQARGLTCDRRTDIWAFGCVLYEMLTGRALFARSTVTDTLAAVVEQPPNWTALPAATPSLVVRLLRRCLEKDARRRLRDIADARMDLEEGDQPSAEAVEATHSRRIAWALATVLFLAALAASAGVWSLTRSKADVPDPVRFAIDLPPGEELPPDAGLPRPVAISNDGRRVVYVTRRPSGNRIYLRRQEDPEARPIAGADGGSGPFFSPDGQWLGFASGGFLRKVAIQGGTPQNITRVSNLLGATWSEDGWIVFHEWDGGLFKVPADGGTPEALTRVDGQRGERAHQAPYSLPGGRSVLFVVSRAEQSPVVELVHVSSGARTRLMEGSDPQYLSSGHILFTRAGRLYAVPFDLTRLELSGPAFPVVEGTSVVVVQDRGWLAAALNGTLAYVSAVSSVSRLALIDPDDSTRNRPVVDETHAYRHPRFSPDGTRLLVFVTVNGINELWVYDLLRNTPLRLSVSGATGTVSRPIWSHDGKRIIFQKDGSLYSMPADDSAAPEILLARDSSGSVYPLAMSRDGRTLVYSRPSRETNRDIFVLPTGGKPTPFLVTPSDERSAMLSPDGRWMVYAALETGREEEVYIRPYPGPGERILVSAGGGREPVWSPSGDEIFYRSNDGERMMAVPIRSGPAPGIGRARTLFEGAFRPGTFWAEYDVNPKTRQFVMLSVDGSVRPRLMVAVNGIVLATPR